MDGQSSLKEKAIQGEVRNIDYSEQPAFMFLRHVSNTDSCQSHAPESCERKRKASRT